MDTLTAATATRWIDLSLIDLPKYARPHRPEDLESLAQDVLKEGQLQEIVVIAQGDRFEVVAGVGRTLAAQKLKWEKIRCFVKDSLSEFDRLHITFSENEEREDASPLYQGQLLQRMLPMVEGSQDKLADKIGKSRPNVTQYLTVAGLRPEVQEVVNRFTNLGLTHLLQLCRLKTSEEQIALAKEASQKELSVKELKALVDKKLKTSSPESAGGGSKDSPPSASFKFSGKPMDAWVTFSGQYPIIGNWDDFVVNLKKAFDDWRAKGAKVGKKASSAPAMTPLAPSSVRLAETPEEEAELLDLATGSDSPAALYAWVYGKDSPITRSAGKATWADMRPSDPRDFVKQFFKRNQ